MIEHLPAEARKQVLKIVRESLKKKGNVLLTIDLKKNTDIIWNDSEGKIVEDELAHGNLEMLNAELRDIRLRNISIVKQVMPACERVDIALVLAENF